MVTMFKLQLLFFAGLLVCCNLHAASLEGAEETGSSETARDAASSTSGIDETSSAATTGSERPKNQSSHGNPTAVDRLMKELKRIHKSETYKKGYYSVEPVGDSLINWRVKIYPSMIDADSNLYKDLIALREKGEKDFIELDFSFKGAYPFSPPLVRLIYPNKKSRHLFDGGAVCTELLTQRVRLDSSETTATTTISLTNT